MDAAEHVALVALVSDAWADVERHGACFKF